MGGMDLFSQDSRENVNLRAVKYLNAFSKLLKDEPSRKSLVVSDTFNLQFRIIENDNDTGWVEKIANVGSDGTPKTGQKKSLEQNYYINCDLTGKRLS